MRDSSGLVTQPNTNGCSLEGVQTSKVFGYLQKSRCFVATAAFRSMDAAPVALLRQFRDELLLEFAGGRAFVHWYYRWSPPAAEWLLRHPAFELPVLAALAPLEILAWICLRPVAARRPCGGGGLDPVGGLRLPAGAKVPESANLRRQITCTRIALGGLLALGACSSPAPAPAKVDPNSPSPYIDSIRSSLPPETSRPDESPQPYIDSVKKDLDHKKSQSSEDYAEKERAKLPAVPSSEGYAESQRAQLEPEGEGAIAAYNEGHSELQAKKVGSITGEFGLRIGAELTRSINASTGNGGTAYQAFTNVYGTNYRPDVTIFYEKDVFRSEAYGTLGLKSMLGFTFFDGYGTFQFPIAYGYTPAAGSSGGAVGTTSQTKFDFFLVPVTESLDYHFNFSKYVRPYVTVGPSAIIYDEMRLDSNPGNRGYSFGVMSSLGRRSCSIGSRPAILGIFTPSMASSISTSISSTPTCPLSTGR